MGKYMYFELETSYSKERYICKNDTNKYDFQNANDFLTEHCFCDAYELLEDSFRNCTEEEEKQIDGLLEKHKNDNFYDLWDAQKEACYPNHDSVNEIIMKLASK